MYLQPDATRPIGFWSETTGHACYAGFLEGESEEKGYYNWFAYVFDADGNPVAWAQVHSIDDLADLVERGCSYRFDYLYGDAGVFGHTVYDLRDTSKYEEIEEPAYYFADMASALESDEELFFDENLLVISAGEWLIDDNPFPDPAGWLNRETYEKVKAEVDSWPDWKKEAYGMM